MELLQVKSVEEARRLLLECLQGRKKETDRIAAAQAPGRILAEDLVAEEAIPAFRRSTVDGYAVQSADLAAASDSIPVFLRCIGQVEMGAAAGFSVTRGTCGLIATGGMVPDGADAVVMTEYCEPFGAGDVAICQPAAPGENVVRCGEDAAAGQLLLQQGRRLTPQAVGVLAATGRTEISVYRPLSLFLISTGDELVSPQEKPGPGQVRDVNTHALRALAERSGFAVTGQAVLTDDAALLLQTIQSKMADTDLIAVSGGSSQGEKDRTANVIAKAARPGVFLHGLALKPGKPTILGWDADSETLLAGLPGHPVSAFMVFELLFAWLSRQYTQSPEPFGIQAVLTRDVTGGAGRTACLPVRLLRDEAQPGYQAEPVYGKSGLITTLTQADGYIIIDRNQEGVRKGAAVSVHLFA